MAFKGDVGQLSLLNIYQALNLNRQSGILVINSGKIKRKVQFLPNGIRLLANYPGDHKGLKQILIKLKILTETQFTNVISTKNDEKMPIGDFLFYRRIIDEDAIEGPISKHILEQIYETFSWKLAKYEFHAGIDAEDLELFGFEGPGKGLTFKVPNVLMEVARREDEWNRILAEIPSDKEIFVPVNRSEFLKKNQYEAEIASESICEIKELIDGERSIEAICQETTLSNYETYIALIRLTAEGEIRAYSIEEKKELAEKLRKKGKIRELIDVYNYLLSVEPDDLQTRLTLVSILERKKDFASFLGEHYQLLAEHFMAHGDMNQAKNYLLRLLEIDPSSTAAQEKLFEVHCQLGNNREALDLIRQVIDSVKLSKDYARGTTLLEKIIAVYPDDPSLYHEAAELHQLNGNVPDAVAHLKTAATIYERRRDITRFRKTYERIAGLDSSELPTLKRIQDLEKRKTRPTQGLAPLLAAAGIAAFIGLAGYWIAMEVFSRQAFAAIDKDVQILAESGRYKDAQNILNSIAQSFPFNLKRLEISNRLNNIASDQWKMVAKIRQDAEKENLLFGSFLAQVEKLRRERKFGDALNQIQGIRRVSLSPENLSTLKKFEAEIHGIFNQAQLTLKKAQSLTQAGKLQEAHPLYLKLLMEFSSTPVVQNLKIPIQMKTTPPGADVYVNDQLAGKSPLILNYNPFEKFRLKITKEGFQDFICGDPAQEQSCFDFTKDWSVSAFLKRLPSWTLNAAESIGSAYSFDGQNLFMGGPSGKVSCIRIDSREVRWTHTAPKNAPIKSELRQWKNLLYFVTSDGQFCALNKENGQPQVQLYPVKNSIAFRIHPSLPSEDGVVGVVSKPFIYGVNLATGSHLWNYPAESVIEDAPAIYNHQVICPTAHGEILVIDEASGNLVKSIDLKSPLSASGSEHGGSYFIADTQGTIYRIQLKNFEIQWMVHSEMSSLSSPRVQQDTIIITSSQGNVLAFDSLKGSRKWDVKVQDGFSSAGIIANQQLFIGSQKGILYCFDLQTGQFRWTFQADASFSAPPRLESGMVIVSTEKNTLYSFGSF